MTLSGAIETPGVTDRREFTIAANQDALLDVQAITPVAIVLAPEVLELHAAAAPDQSVVFATTSPSTRTIWTARRIYGPVTLTAAGVNTLAV